MQYLFGFRLNLFSKGFRLDHLGEGAPAHDPELHLLGAGNLCLEDDGTIFLCLDGLAFVPDLFLGL